MTKAFLLVLLGGCAVVDGNDDACNDGKCDATVDQRCDDTRYGDGTCNLQLDCKVPDIDCFETFANDQAASVWYQTQEAWVAQQKGKAPRTILPVTDPRHAQMRALLDRGWAAFRQARPVGKLAQATPGLVLVDDPEANAYVIGDTATQRSPFTVMVQTGFLAVDATDEAKLGVMMHELQHGVGLHLIGDVGTKLERHYLADRSEPIGRDQPDDAAARTAIGAWRDAASEVGQLSTIELAGFPLSGDLLNVLSTALAAGKSEDAAKCARADTLVNALSKRVTGAIDKLDNQLSLDPATLPPDVTAALTELRDVCLAGFPYDVIQVMAVMANTTPAQIEAQMKPADVALVKGKHVVDGIAALTQDRRAAMRAIETALPWPAARYFSYEEDADDVSTFVMRAAGLEPAAEADFLVNALTGMSSDAGAKCKATLAAGERPSYGRDLSDPHHAICWRAYHLAAIASKAGEARVAPPPVVDLRRIPNVGVLPLPHPTRRISD